MLAECALLSADSPSSHAISERTSALPWESTTELTVPAKDDEHPQATTQQVAKRLGKSTKEIARKAQGRKGKKSKGKKRTGAGKGSVKQRVGTLQSNSRSLLRTFQRYRPLSKRAAARKAANDKRRKGELLPSPSHSIALITLHAFLTFVYHISHRHAKERESRSKCTPSC